MADPTYTQVFESYTHTGFTDNTWTTVTDGSHASVVLEIIMENIQQGTENQTGVRAYGSSLARIVDIHEAEAGGNTHCRMFVQTNASSQFQVYAEDYTDAVWYVVGYWSDVTFTEAYTQAVPSGINNQFNDQTLVSGASCVHHILSRAISEAQAEAAMTVGVRANDSSLSRTILMHEAEAGGYTYLDFLVKADASKIIEVYKYVSGSVVAYYYDVGYFSSELNFVEKWEDITPTIASLWQNRDLTSYLDQDGRTCDFLLTHREETAYRMLGIRGGGTSTSRYLTEHEAESAGSGNEYTGFGISAVSDANGNVQAWYNFVTTNYGKFMLTGYFKLGTGLVSYSGKSLRRADKLDFYYGESTRFATKLSSYIGNTFRSIKYLSSYLGSTYRSTKNTLSYIGKTVRKPSKLAEYVGNTDRLVLILANHVGNTVRNIWNVTQYIGDAIRGVSSTDSIYNQSSRYVGSGLSYSGKTIRFIFGVANYVGKTSRIITSIG